MLNIRSVLSAKQRGFSAVTSLAVIATGLLFTSVTANAQVIIDGEGFESPAYSTTFAPPGLPIGSLEGQLALLPGDGISTKWVASVGTDSTAVLQTAVAHPSDPGGQAVRVDRTSGDLPSFWGAPVVAWPDSARYVCIEWDMRVDGPSGLSGEFGPYFGVDAIDDAGVGSGEGLIGSLGVLGTSGDVVYTDAATGALKQTGATVGFGEWNHFRLDLDFDLHVYTMFLNTVPLLTAPFAEGAGLDDFSDAPLATFAFDADLPGTAYFDNYLVFQADTKIPEPTTLVLGFAACTALVATRRRRLA